MIVSLEGVWKKKLPIKLMKICPQLFGAIKPVPWLMAVIVKSDALRVNCIKKHSLFVYSCFSFSKRILLSCAFPLWAILFYKCIFPFLFWYFSLYRKIESNMNVVEFFFVWWKKMDCWKVFFLISKNSQRRSEYKVFFNYK